MPASAVQTKTWFRPKGWFNDRELGIIVNRVLRDDPSKGKNSSCGMSSFVVYWLTLYNKGDMHNRQAITPRRLWAAMKDYDLWPVCLLVLWSQVFTNENPRSMQLVLLASFRRLHRTIILHLHFDPLDSALLVPFLYQSNK